MGDRANIFIKSDFGHGDGRGVYFYTHWSGHELPVTLQSALARRERWSDDSYLARVIFCEMVKGEERDSMVGYGISAYLGDNEHKIIVVDAHAQTVGFHRPYYNDPRGFCATPIAQWSFEEYVALTVSAITEAYYR